MLSHSSHALKALLHGETRLWIDAIPVSNLKHLQLTFSFFLRFPFPLLIEQHHIHIKIYKYIDIWRLIVYSGRPQEIIVEELPELQRWSGFESGFCYLCSISISALFVSSINSGFVLKILVKGFRCFFEFKCFSVCRVSDWTAVCRCQICVNWKHVFLSSTFPFNSGGNELQALKAADSDLSASLYLIQHSPLPKKSLLRYFNCVSFRFQV